MQRHTMKTLLACILLIACTSVLAWERTYVDPDGFGGYRYRTWSTEGSGYTWGSVKRRPDGGYKREHFGDSEPGIWDIYYEEEMRRMLDD